MATELATAPVRPRRPPHPTVSNRFGGSLTEKAEVERSAVTQQQRACRASSYDGASGFSGQRQRAAAWHMGVLRRVMPSDRLPPTLPPSLGAIHRATRLP